MKLKILVIIGILIPTIAYAQDYYDFDSARENEIGRTLALMQSEAEYNNSLASPGQYERSFYTAESEASSSMEDALTSAEDNYQSAVTNYQEAEKITQTADDAVQDAMSTATQNLPGAPDDWGYTNMDQMPQPKTELPPPENKFQSSLSEKVRSFFGERTYGSFGMNSGYIHGSTRYRISFDNPGAGDHMESELIWPLANPLMGVNGTLRYRTADSSEEDPRDMLRFGMEWHTRLSKSSGHIQDSDWIENDVDFITSQGGPVMWNHPGKDIYSESDTSVDQANIIDLNGTYNFWLTKNIAISPRVGFRYQKFAFSAYSLNQIGYGPYGPGPFDMSYYDTEHLKWLKYSIKTNIPYVGLSSEFAWNKFSFLCKFDYSSWVRVNDEDTHLYPNVVGFDVDMISKGHSKGRAYMLGFEGGWKFWPDWELSVGTSFLKMFTGGSMVQETYVNGTLVGVSVPITERIISKYWMTNASIRYVF